MSEQPMTPEKRLELALFHLRDDGNFKVLLDALEKRREEWIDDLGRPPCYQNHAELSGVSARISEIDWLLDAVKAAGSGQS